MLKSYYEGYYSALIMYNNQLGGLYFSVEY